MMGFWRGIDDRLQEKVKQFWQGNVGHEIINCEYGDHKQFQVCIRNNYFNVYWRGCSVLKYQPNAHKHVYTIHHKYVDTDAEKTYVDLKFSGNDLIYEDTNWSFKDNILNPANNGNIPIVDDYSGDEKGEKRSLSVYIDREEPCWLDLEIAFSRKKESDEVEKRKIVADRIDLAEIVLKDDIPTLKFVEVKIVSDSRLRARGNPEIFRQMERYKKFIEDQKKKKGKKAGLLKSYKTVAQNLLDFGLVDGRDDLVERFVEDGDIDDYPHLLIIGDISELEKGAYGNHWGKLCEWTQKEGFPTPIIYPAER
jgi:hypothetical protein